MEYVEVNAGEFVKRERINSVQKMETFIATMDSKLIYVQTADNLNRMWPAYDDLESK